MSSALVNMSSVLDNMSNAYVTAFRAVVINFIPFYSSIQYNKGFTLPYILKQIKFVINAIYEDGADKSELIQLIIVELRKHFKNKIAGGKHYRKKSLKKNDGNIFKIHLNEWENSVIKKMQENPKQSGGTGGTKTRAPPPHGFIPKLLKLLFIIVVFAQLFSTPNAVPSIPNAVPSTPNAVPSTVNVVPPVQVDRSSTEVVKAFLELKNSEMPQRVIDLFPNIQGVCAMLTSAMANALLPHIREIWMHHFVTDTYIYPEPRNFDIFSNKYSSKWKNQVGDIQRDYEGRRSGPPSVLNFGVDDTFIRATFYSPHIMDPYVSDPKEFYNLSTKETHELSEKYVRDYFEKYLIESKLDKDKRYIHTRDNSKSSPAELNPYQSYDTVNNLQIAIFLISSLQKSVGIKYHAVLGGYNVNTKKLFIMDPNRLVKMNPDTYIFEWDPVMIAEDGAFSKSDLILAGSLIQTIKGSILKAYADYHINDGEYHINDGEHNSSEPRDIASIIEQVFIIPNIKSPLVSKNWFVPSDIGSNGPYANPFATFSKVFVDVVGGVYKLAYKQIEAFNKEYEEKHQIDKRSFLHPPNSENNYYKESTKEKLVENYKAAKNAVTMLTTAPGAMLAYNKQITDDELARLKNAEAKIAQQRADEEAQWRQNRQIYADEEAQLRIKWAKAEEDRNAQEAIKMEESKQRTLKYAEEAKQAAEKDEEYEKAKAVNEKRFAEEKATAEKQAAEKQAAEEQAAKEQAAKKNTLSYKIASFFKKGGKTHKNKKSAAIKINRGKIHKKRSTRKNKY